MQKIWVLGCLIVTLCGCRQPVSMGEQEKFGSLLDTWFVTGRIVKEGFENAGVVAVSIDGTKYKTILNEQGLFSLNLPGNNTYAIHFVPNDYIDNSSLSVTNKKSQDEEKKEFFRPALLQYEESEDIGLRDSLRLPPITTGQKLNLGEIDIKENFAFASNNPSNILDFDQDGLSDFLDLDDQNDGLSDDLERSKLEWIDICHVSFEKGSRSINSLEIPLSALFNHLNHGDVLGECRDMSQGSQRKNEEELDEDNFENIKREEPLANE